MVKLSLDDKIVVAVTGLPGSGKSTFLRAAKELGCYLIIMGDFVRKEAAHRNMQPTAENLARLMFQMREERGRDVIAQLTVEEADKANSSFIVIDGVRNPEEIERFKHVFRKFYLISIESTAELRFGRIKKRFRSDDSTERDRFEDRDIREINVGVRRTMALADLTINNDGALGEFKFKVKNLLGEIMREFSNSNRG